jgi:type IV fimbrial biogenesis protein FimT
MVVVAIVAIVAVVATPSWNRLVVSNRIRAAVNDWTLSMHFARSEAVRRNVPVTLCPSSDGSTCTTSDYEAGWIVKTQLPAVNGEVLQDTLPKQRLTMVPNSSTKRNITFLPNGTLIGNYTGVHITVRDDPAEDDSLSRHICVPRTGRIKVYTDDQYMNLPASAC